MDSVGIIVGVSWIVAGVICMGLAIPLIRGKVRMNPFYGVRFRESYLGEEHWYAINRYGGKRMAIWAAPLIVVGVVSLFLPLQRQAGLTYAVGFGPLVFIFIPVIESWRFARSWRIRRSLHAPMSGADGVDADL